MNNDIIKNKIFSRRLLILTFLKSALFFTLAARLFYLQIIKFKAHRTLADSNRIRSYITLPLRGNILDNSDKELASSTSYYRILFAKENATNISKTLQKLADILGIERKKLYYYSHKFQQKSSAGATLLYEDLNWQEVAKVEANKPDLPGIMIDIAQRRYYPLANSTAHLIGYVSAVTEDEMRNKNNPLLSHPDFKIGKNGLERSFENHLRGSAGIKYLEVDAFGGVIRELSFDNKVSKKDGQNLNLTIDSEIQQYAYKVTKDQRVSLVLVDVNNGDIISMISNPAFNPNDFVTGIGTEEWESLIADPGKPMINKAIANQYPPGSTFKTIVTLAALAEDFNPKKIITCKGVMHLGRRKYHCWKKHGHGKVDLKDAITQSCNIYFYHLAHEIGIQKIVAMAQKFGLGKKTNVTLPGERSGFLPSKDWKKEIYGQRWSIGDSYNSAIGQGFVEATTIQLAMLTAKLANLGKDISPNLLSDTPQTLPTEIDVNKAHIQFVLDAMHDVVNSRKGTSYWHRIHKKSMKMGGKTGTSQVVAIDHSIEDKEEKILAHKNHGLFIGFAPTDKPRFAISVIVEHGGSGSGSAAPIARKILQKVQEKYNTNIHF
jgi:penicillin-binding protein 2